MAVVLRRVVVLVVEGRVAGSPVHHLGLAVHHVARHGSVRAVRATGPCVRREHCQGVTFLSHQRPEGTAKPL